MLVTFSAFHWQPVRSTKKIASIAARSGTRGLWQPGGSLGRGGSSGSIVAHSSSGSRQPSSRTCALMIHRHASTSKAHQMVVSMVNAYRDRLLAWLCTSGWPAGDEHEAVEQVGWDFLHLSAARRRSESRRYPQLAPD
jgi:hypothetical protein